VVLTLEKARTGDDTEVEVGHSYTPSLVVPLRRISPVRRSFTIKDDDKNSTETALVEQNCEIEIKFFFIEGTQRTSFNLNRLLEAVSEVEPVLVIRSPVPSPIITSSEPL